MDDSRHHGRGLLVLGIVLALVPGVGFAVWGIRYFSSQSGGLALFIWTLLIAFVLVSMMFVVFGRRIFSRFGLTFGERLSSTVTPLVAALGSSLSGDPKAMEGAVAEAGKKFASWYSSVTLRRWIVSGTVALLAVFGSLVGIALLEQQNSLLEAQNLLITAQNDFFRRQLRQEDIQDYHARRAELIKTLFDERECFKGEEPLDRHTGCPASRVETRVAAAVSLNSIETAVRESPERRSYIRVPDVTDLGDIDLRGARIVGVDFRKVDMSEAHLEGAWLESVDLSGANLTFAKIGVMDPRGQTTHFVKVKLQGADLGHSNLQWIDFDADFDGAILQQANLVGANFSAAKNLETTDLSNARCCPETSARGTIWPGSGPSRGYTFTGCIITPVCNEPFPFAQFTWDQATGTRRTEINYGQMSDAERKNVAEQHH